MKFLLADIDRLWLRSCSLWLDRRGDEVHALCSTPDLDQALCRDAEATLLLAPQLLEGLGEQALRVLAGTAQGLLWRAARPSLRGPRLGYLISPHMPRPRSPAQLESQLRFLARAAQAGSLELPVSGEILGLSKAGPAAAVDAFTAETARLLAQLESTANARESRLWQQTLHAWRGCAAVMGARGLLDFPLPEEVNASGLLATDGPLQALRRAREETLSLLAAGAAAYT